ncbi:MAG: thioredoxin domain-containing protein, partial [Gemmatimonadota bacterium]
MMKQTRPTNRLTNETSAYLSSAAGQPVDWWPWGDEAFARAKAEDKPILLDSGAVWCHWCHVMDGESYENPEIAAVINEHFIPVKLDRDERPDVDARYQRAVQAMTGEGGWPLTAFLTPEGDAFFGGTYFPPEDRYGRPGFRRLLERVADLYRSERGKVTESASKLRERLAGAGDGAEPGELRARVLDEVLDAMAGQFDFRYGGFGHAPKFPHPTAIDLALTYHAERPLEWAQEMVRRTLDGMAHGGIHDQLGGGFHRYATDARWIVPHFEKMLYDNAELLRAYARAYAAFGEPLDREVSDGIVRWVLGEMTDPAGGFYASQDADVGHDDDGAYWTWTVEEARAALGDGRDLEFAQRAFDIYEQGEMPTDPERNVLWVAREAPALAAEFACTPDEARETLTRVKEKMKAARDRRPAPAVDTTLYTSWNAMMASALLDAACYLGRADARDAALRALDRLWADVWDDARGLSHRLGDPEGPRLLDDHVQAASAWLDAFEVTQDPEHFSRARRCVDAAIR